MDIQKELQQASGFLNFDLLAKSIVEGFISGMHKSPFHGFSAEFAEHKIYNNGESTRHIDWKLFAKTDKLYTKRYDEETNLRCHLGKTISFTNITFQDATTTNPRMEIKKRLGRHL